MLIKFIEVLETGIGCVIGPLEVIDRRHVTDCMNMKDDGIFFVLSLVALIGHDW